MPDLGVKIVQILIHIRRPASAHQTHNTLQQQSGAATTHPFACPELTGHRRQHKYELPAAGTHT